MGQLPTTEVVGLQVISDGSSIVNGLCFLDSYDRLVDRKPFGVAFSIPIVEFDISCSVEISIEGETTLNTLENSLRFSIRPGNITASRALSAMLSIFGRKA